MVATGRQAEVESKVHLPCAGLGLAAGLIFLLFGVFGMIFGPRLFQIINPPFPWWVPIAFFSVFAMMGTSVVYAVATPWISPVFVRHTPADILPDVSTEPLVQDGLVVHQRLAYELERTEDGWKFWGSPRLWRKDVLLRWGFGVPFLVTFAGVLTWVFHEELKLASWPLAAAYAILVTTVCGGTPFVLIGFILKARYRSLCQLVIPDRQDHVELDCPTRSHLNTGDWFREVKWTVVGDTDRRQISIPKERVAAVQLCPWKYLYVTGASDTSTSITWAVQGLLILHTDSGPRRLPLLLSSDYPGAARLMEHLAEVLNVPYLFHADAEGWRAEILRAKTRPPIQCGGVVS